MEINNIDNNENVKIFIMETFFFKYVETIESI